MPTWVTLVVADPIGADERLMKIIPPMMGLASAALSNSNVVQAIALALALNAAESTATPFLRRRWRNDL